MLYNKKFDLFATYIYWGSRLLCASVAVFVVYAFGRVFGAW